MSNISRLCLLISGLLVFQSSAFSQFSLGIKITGIKNDKGVIMLQLLDSLEQVAGQEKGAIGDGISEMRINNIASGSYAVRYFQDVNLNGELDKNKLGIPVEGYGFSNNAYGMFGPKPFRDWLFRIEGDTSLILKIKY